MIPAGLSECCMFRIVHNGTCHLFCLSLTSSRAKDVIHDLQFQRRCDILVSVQCLWRRQQLEDTNPLFRRDNLAVGLILHVYMVVVLRLGGNLTTWDFKGLFLIVRVGSEVDASLNPLTHSAPFPPTTSLISLPTDHPFSFGPRG